MDGSTGCFQDLAALNYAAINTGVQAWLYLVTLALWERHQITGVLSFYGALNPTELDYRDECLRQPPWAQICLLYPVN